jgi:antitoxin ParD1/3/4
VPTRNVSLTEHLDGFVEGAVASGRYQNASEVVREGLRLLERRNDDDDQRLTRLLEAVDIAEGQFARGEFVEVAPETLEAFVAELGREASAKVKAARGEA